MAIDRKAQDVPSGNPATGSVTIDSQVSDAEVMAREDQNTQRALMEMLIEDARNGRIKDPKGRNVKGRREKGSKIASRDRPAGSADRVESPEAAELTDTKSEDGAGSVISAAASSLKTLRSVIKPGGDVREKLVDRFDLV